MLEVIQSSCQFASDLYRLHYLKAMTKIPMVGKAWKQKYEVAVPTATQ